MKLQILQENFAKAITLASRFTTTRAQLPILGNILLSSSKTKLTVSSTNLEISVSTSLGAKVEKEGEISIPSKVLSELVGNLPKETLSLEAEKEHLKISSSSFSSDILGMNTSDFPKIPSSVHKDKSFNLPKAEFSDGLSRVIFATSVDETRPILTGILFLLSKEGLTLVATDGFRLSRKIIKTNSFKGNFKFILPKTILSEVGRLGEIEEVVFEVQEKEKQVVFEIGDTVLSSRLLEGEFPDYEKIIPKSTTTKVSLDKEDLLRAVKLSAPFARDNANIVKIKVQKEGITVSAESSQAGSQETKVEAKVEGESKIEIAFNYKFLEEFLGSVKGEEVRMEFSGNEKAGIFLDPSDSDYLHLIMPVRIQG